MARVVARIEPVGGGHLLYPLSLILRIRVRDIGLRIRRLDQVDQRRDGQQDHHRVKAKCDNFVHGHSSFDKVGIFYTPYPLYFV